MLIVMANGHKKEDVDLVVKTIEKQGLKALLLPGENCLAIGITGNRGPLDREKYLSLPGVKDAVPVTKPYKLVGRDFGPKATEIKVGNVVFGPGRFVVIGGPCAVESEEQTLRIAEAVKKNGANVLRGGAYKPRSSPYAFQGLGEPGLKILAKARKLTGLPIVTEAVDLQSLEKVCEYADVIQIGTRNMQNFTLLQEVGKARKPVLLKRGMSATIDEWLSAAEYILDCGNSQVILCERGLRSYDKYTRNLLDLTAVPVAQELSHLPVLVDPSHSTGKRDKVIPASRAALAIGASGVIVDVHDKPHEALCDGPQALLPEEFGEMVVSLRKIATAMDVEMYE